MATKLVEPVTFPGVRLTDEDVSSVKQIRAELARHSLSGSVNFAAVVRYLLHCYRCGKTADIDKYAKEVFK